MIKKTYLSLIFMTAALLFSALPTRALYWGVFNDFDDNYSYYGAYKYLHNIPIKYYVEDITEEMEEDDDEEEDVKTKIFTTLSAEQKQAEFSKIIEQAFNAWPKQTKAMIQKDGRSQEFADILNLPKTVIVKKTTDKNNADIIFYFTTRDILDEECGEDSGGCITAGEEQPEVFLPNIYIDDPDDDKSQEIRKKDLLHITIHELGHYFGLTDEYEEFFQSSLTHNNSDRMFNDDSIMAGSDETNLGCDDVDGFINLIDLTLAMKPGLKIDDKNLEFSQRAKKGWASFCNGKKNGKGEVFKPAYYKEAKTLNHSDYQRKSMIYKYDKDGNLEDFDFIHVFNLYNTQILSYDKNNLPFQVKDNKRNVEYTYYNFIPEEEIEVYIDIPNGDMVTMKLHNDNNTWSGICSYQRFSITSKEKCTLKEVSLVSGESFEAVFNSNVLEKYTYSSKVGFSGAKGIKKVDPIKFSVDNNSNCVFSYNDIEALSFNISNGEEIGSNQSVLNDIATKFNLSYQQIKQEVNSICQHLLEDIKRDAETCKYFKDL